MHTILYENHVYSPQETFDMEEHNNMQRTVTLLLLDTFTTSSLHTVGNMGVMKCLGQGGLRSLSASSICNKRVFVFNVAVHISIFAAIKQ